MVKISDCSCECRDKGKEQQIEERALSSINKILGTEGQAYYPDGTGAVKIPIADADDLKNAQEVPQLKISVKENTDHLETVDNVLDVHARSIKQNTDDIAGLDTLTDALTKELPTDFKLYKPSAGKIQLQYETEDQSLINSNVLDMVIPESYDIVSGTTSRSFKLKITFSDGTSVTTNDFVIPEGGGTSVSVTGITLTKSGNALKTAIQLDDGSSIESGTVQMVSSVAGTFANKQLTITVNGVSSVPIGIDTGGSYTAGTGIKIVSGTISVDDTVVALKSDIADMETKTNANSTFATKTALTTLQNSVKDCFSEVDYDSTTQKLSFTALDGQINDITLSGGVRWVDGYQPGGLLYKINLGFVKNLTLVSTSGNENVSSSLLEGVKSTSLIQAEIPDTHLPGVIDTRVQSGNCLRIGTTNFSAIICPIVTKDALDTGITIPVILAGVLGFSDDLTKRVTQVYIYSDNPPLDSYVKTLISN